MAKINNSATSVLAILLMASVSMAVHPSAAESVFPEGTATLSETCGACHKAIYSEFAHGFGGNIHYSDLPNASASDAQPSPPAKVSGGAMAHAVAGVDPFPLHARDVEEGGKSCNVCHFPEAFSLPDMNIPEMIKPRPRPKGKETGGLTCASCHLTPEGKIRAPHAVNAPHPTIVDPAIQTSAICASCHSSGKRVVGKQSQTFLEWRDDYYKPGLGKQQCQDCHMPRTMRKVTETSNAQERAVARHLWTGGRSPQRLSSAFSLVVVQPVEGKDAVEFHVINIGAGHSIPTGSNRRAVCLIAHVIDDRGQIVAFREWMFAPWYGNRPDDKRFVEDDWVRPDAVAAVQADNQGPHETIIRAGEERVLSWIPKLPVGDYTVKARLVYYLNRYNTAFDSRNQTEFSQTALFLRVNRVEKR